MPHNEENDRPLSAKERRRLWGAILVIFLLLVTAGLAMGRAAEESHAQVPCVNEDGSGGPLPCFWNAKTMGNGWGVSFDVLSDGTVVYK